MLHDCTYNVFVRYRRMSRGHYAPSRGQGWEARQMSDLHQVGQQIFQFAFQGVFGLVGVDNFHTAVSVTPYPGVFCLRVQRAAAR